MHTLPLRRTALACTVLSLLAGCTTPLNQVQNKAAADFDTARQHMTAAPAGSPVKEMSTQWINPVPLNVKDNTKEKLPDCAITLVRRGDVTLADVSAAITADCGIPVVVTPDAWSAASGGGSTTRMSGAVPPPVAVTDPTAMVPLDRMGASAVRAVTRSGGDVLRGLRWEGALSGLLDHVTARLGLSWRYEHGRVTIFWLDTRTFPIDFQDLQARFSSSSVYGSTSPGGEGATSEGTTTQTTITDMNSNRYRELEATVKSMLTPETGRMAIAGGVLTVTDTPRVLNAVERFIGGRNAELTRQVGLNVKIWSVNKKRQDQVGIDWSAVFSSGSVGLSLGNAMSGMSGSAMSGGMSILDGKFANSNAFLHALAEQANVSLVTENTTSTMNLTPARIQSVTQQDYISEVSTENTANVGSSTSVQKSTISTGFNMTLLPFIRPASDSMELQFSISMSDDPDMQPEKVGEVTLKQPKTKMFNQAQTVVMRSGQSLLLSGYMQSSSASKRQGVGSPGFFGLGGGANAEAGNTIVVIMITPTLME